MSKNLFKGYYTNVQQEDARIIAVNEMMEKRMEELNEKLLREKREAASDGFSVGLQMDMVEAQDADDENPGNVIKAVTEEDSRLIKDAESRAAEIVARAEDTAAKICEQARKQAESESRQTIANAREQGLEQGRQDALQEVHRLEQQFNAREKELETEYQKQIDALEPRFVETISGIYEHIFNVDLQSYRDILLHLIATTLRKAEGSKDFIIHVSKDDYPYVSMQKKQITSGIVSANSTVEIIEDMTLTKNECLIETDGGIFDCGLGTQLSELRKKLMLLSYEQE